MKMIPMSRARMDITKLPELLSKDPGEGAVVITRRGEPVLAVMTYELYDALIETLEVLGDPELMKALRQGINDMKEGRTTPWEEVKAELEL
ncbi:MAG: type II toxin-antitoxin system Phd/YefM family antitoxin [Candidatus Eremiobacteraeota bacterium]|nr:type II toxin-antitoxin system Phd/YefM family antitoxin [Candidatus Eremiobacteraeota bacterium]